MCVTFVKGNKRRVFTCKVRNMAAYCYQEWPWGSDEASWAVPLIDERADTLTPSVSMHDLTSTKVHLLQLPWLVIYRLAFNLLLQFLWLLKLFSARWSFSWCKEDDSPRPPSVLTLFSQLVSCRFQNVAIILFNNQDWTYSVISLEPPLQEFRPVHLG